MAIRPPEHSLWWNERLSGAEIGWISIAFIWGLVMFGTMVTWHFIGKQNLSNEAYRINAANFGELTEAMAEQYTVRTEGNLDTPVVHPPAGGDIYMLARLWEWWPALELEKDQTYRLHLSSMDWQHGFSLQPQNINIQVHPGYEMVLTIKPDQVGEYSVVCNEFCGIGHHTMLGKIYVVAKK